MDDPLERSYVSHDEINILATQTAQARNELNRFIRDVSIEARVLETSFTLVLSSVEEYREYTKGFSFAEILGVSDRSKSQEEQMLDSALKFFINKKLKSKEDLKGKTDDQEDVRNNVMYLIMEKINNYASQLAGQDKQMTYSGPLVNACLNVYSAIGPKNYEKIRKSGIDILPSSTTCRNKLKPLSSGPGMHPRMFGVLQDLDPDTNSSKVGRLVFDEFKLKGGILYSNFSGELKGFVEADTTGGIIETALDTGLMSAAEAKYCNLWRYCGSNGRHQRYNTSYFFNNGTLNAADLLNQFMGVLTGLESVGWMVYGLCCDAGGANARFMTMMRNLRHPKETDTLLQDDEVSFTHPLDNRRRISFFFCSAHLLKAVRTQFHKSSRVLTGKGTKVFRKKDVFGNTCYFGWQTIRRLYNADIERSKSTGCPRRIPHLTGEAVNPNGYLGMRVHLAKSIYDARTINFLIDYICERIEKDYGFTKREAVSKAKSSVSLKVAYASSIEIGLFDQRLSMIKQWYKSYQRARKNPEGPPLEVLDDDIVDDLFSLEFMIRVHEIFNNMFLNSKCCITSDNYDKVKKHLNVQLTYFRDWIKEIPINDDPKRVFAIVTWRNMQTMVSGFLSFAKSLLDQSTVSVQYVPTLYSTSSTIEAQFSDFRRMNHDTTATVDWAMKRSLACQSIPQLSRKTNVNSDDLEDNERSSKYVDISKLHKLQKVREDFASRIVHSLTSVTLPQTASTTSITAVEIFKGSLSSAFVKDFVCSMNLLTSNGDFLEYWCQNEFVLGWLKTLSSNVECKKDITKLTCTQEGLQHLLQIYHLISIEYLTLMDKQCGNKKSTRKTYPFEYYWYKLFIGKTFDDIFARTIPAENKLSQTTKFVVISIIENFLLIKVRNIIKSKIYDEIGDTTIKDVDMKLMVNRFVGYAFSKALRALSRNQHKHLVADDEDKEVISARSSILNIALRHVDAIVDEEYMKHYYSKHDQLNNRGGLFLLRKGAIDGYGTSLLSEVVKSINQTTFGIEGSNLVKDAKKKIKNNATLVGNLEQMMLDNKPDDKTALSQKYLKSLHSFIVDKACNSITKDVMKDYEDQKVDRAEKNGGFRIGLLWTCKKSKKTATTISSRATRDDDDNVNT